MNSKWWVLGLLLWSWGCSQPGGKVGDANDPASTSDAAAMADETGSTGDIKNGTAPKKK